MKLFLDTSSLIKLYYKEEGTSKLDKVFHNYSVTEIYLSEISLTEFHSAIYKKVRTKDLSAQNANDILSSFFADKNKFTFISLDTGIIQSSLILLEKYGLKGLRALDAIQLSSAYSIRNIIDIAVSDNKMLNTFLSLEGIEIL